MPNRVEMLYEVARFIFYEARVLIGSGIGEDEIGNDLGFPGELENIPSDTEEYRWANACVRFIRYIAQHLGPAIVDFQAREDADRFAALLDVTNMETDDKEN